MILFQGEATSNIFVVKKGYVRAFTILSNGNEAIVSIFGAGDYFPNIFDKAKANVSLFYYETMSDVILESFTSEEFMKQKGGDASTYADSSRRYLATLLHVNALMQVNAFEKLAYIMQYLAIRFGTTQAYNPYTRIDLKLTQQDLACLCNLSRETTNIQLMKLKTSGVVIERTKYYSVNLPALTKLIGDETISTVEL